MFKAMEEARPRSTSRVFATYALLSLVPVLVLGVALAASYRAEARRRGLAEGRSQAALVARTAVEPLLEDRPVAEGLTPIEADGLRRLVGRAVSGHDVLRLRIRDLAGRVVFSDDGSGFSAVPDSEAVDSARGEILTKLTHLNADRNDAGPRGVAAVEIYRPLAGPAGHRVGVLEMYLPYAPISRDVSGGLHMLYLNLAAGLGVLYLVLFAISTSATRRLRRHAAANAFLAEHDVLTDLPNRVLFHREAAKAVDAGRGAVTIAIVDLDRFKEVNDTLGHHNGDRLLTELARRLDAHVGSTGTVARLGGDEFGVILSGVDDPEPALHALRDVVDRDIEVNGLPLSVEASIGYALAPDDGTGVDELLQRADVAMYVAKASHAGVVRYDAAQDHYDATNLALVAELRHAIDEGQLVLHYQPKTWLADGSVEAVEALVRWQHPVHGLLYPDRFLPLAEQTDLIDRLTAWVLRTALVEMKGLRPAVDLTVAVNVSARNLTKPGFAADVMATLADVGVPAERLIVEMTETALMADPARAAATLVDLDTAGVQVSLDDFGQGQTSLGYLSALPIRELKIDKAFVGDMLERPAHAAIVQSIVDLGHNLSLRVVAEGVENEAVLARLRETGCDVAQGYFFARPMPSEALGAWLGVEAPAPRRRRARPIGVAGLDG
jgi:diguanylate cyclase (GGDEF)-like protein